MKLLKYLIIFCLFVSSSFAADISPAGTAISRNGSKLYGQNSSGVKGYINYPNVDVYSLQKDFGAKCDNSTDDTLALTNALNAIQSNGKPATLLISGVCKIASPIVVPNDGSVIPNNVPIRLTSSGIGSSNGRWSVVPYMQSGFNFTGTPGIGLANITTYGVGTLEIDHLSLSSSGTGAFVKTTFTQLKIHDNVFSGSIAGASAVNDAIILGGSGWGTTNPNPYDNFFQGYGTIISDNFFDKIRTVGVLNSAANNTVWSANTISATCGNASGEAFLINGSTTETTVGNVFSSNTIEVTNYKHAFGLDRAVGNSFIANGVYDQTATTTSAFRLGSGVVQNNTIIPGYYNTTIPLTSGITPEGQLILDSTKGTKYYGGSGIFTTCNANTRGNHYFFTGGTGKEDIEKVCSKNIDESYSWKPIFYSYSEAEKVANPSFDTDSNWTKGTGWTIGSGVATKTAGTQSDLYQNVGLSQYNTYQISYTLTVSTGSARVSAGGVTGAYKSASGTYTTIVSTTNTDANLYVTGDSTFSGTMDNVSVRKLTAY